MRHQIDRIMAFRATGETPLAFNAAPREIGAVEPEPLQPPGAWPDGDLVALAEAMTQGSISAEATVRGCLARMRRREPTFHAVARPVPSRSLLEAARAGDAVPASARPDPLAGVPFAVKDSFATAGLATTAGSPLFAGWLPKEDASAIASLRACGGLLLAKLHMHELGLGAAPPTRNPWRPEATPGGSSAGAAVAVALDYCPVALGTDTGGSVRLPAAFTGVCGFKPTFGLIGRGGVLPVSWSFDHVGILTRSPRDAQFVLERLAAPDPRDPATASIQHDRWRLVASGTPVVGFLAAADLDGVEPEVLGAYGRARGLFAAAGLTLKTVRLPELAGASEANALIIAVEAATAYLPYLTEATDGPGEDVQLRLSAGLRYRAQHYLRALEVRRAYQREVERMWESVDLLVTPTAPFAAPDLDQVAAPGVRRGMLRYLANLNMAGVPAISVPAGTGRHGLPVAVQLVSPAHTDRALLLTAEWLFRQLDAPRRPRSEAG